MIVGIAIGDGWRLAYSSGGEGSRHRLWTLGNNDGLCPEVKLFDNEGDRRWRARDNVRMDDTLLPAEEAIALLERKANCLQRAADFIRQKEREFAGPPETFGQRLKRLRTERGMTLQELAEASGSGASFLCQIEKGQRGAGLSMGWRKFRALAKALGITVDELADGLADG